MYKEIVKVHKKLFFVIIKNVDKNKGSIINKYLCDGRKLDKIKINISANKIKNKKIFLKELFWFIKKYIKSNKIQKLKTRIK